MSFDLDNFIQQCIAALEESKPQQKISELVGQVVSDSEGLIQTLGKPSRATIEKLYVANNLTILNVIWAPKMTLMPHNHNTWATIGVYSGREDNIFWRRVKDDTNGKIEAAGAKSIACGEVAALGKNIVHSVTNPTSGFTGAIHVYGADFFKIDRSEWDPLSLSENPYDVDKTLGLFEAENAILDYRAQ